MGKLFLPSCGDLLQQYSMLWGRLRLLDVESMLVALPLCFPWRHIYRGESLWCFSSLPGDCNAATAALLTDALRPFHSSNCRLFGWQILMSARQGPTPVERTSPAQIQKETSLARVLMMLLELASVAVSKWSEQLKRKWSLTRYCALG